MKTDIINKREEILRDLYSRNLSEQMKTIQIGENTRAALYFKGKVQDVIDVLFSLHELIYGDIGDEKYNELSEAVNALDRLADSYLINSINDSIMAHEDMI